MIKDFKLQDGDTPKEENTETKEETTETTSEQLTGPPLDRGGFFMGKYKWNFMELEFIVHLKQIFNPLNYE